jgi:hypothetical protein
MLLRTTSGETEPNSTSTAEKRVVASPRIVRLQGGGLRFLDAHEIPQPRSPQLAGFCGCVSVSADSVSG